MKNKKTLIALIVLVMLVIGAFAVWKLNAPQSQAGDKTIVVSVVVDTETSDFVIETDAEFLRGALEQAGLVEGTESEYGLYVTTVNGITADESQKQWWCFTRDGGTLETGVDTTPIADGERYEITLTTGW
ncbi:MAG: DUF4430 domain-containing protein [Oscillospiraceae bacterium]|nr:DUF4430 domain-containing protein [Oscillospiraceae bacterium]